ncbi:MAG: STAS domain-containing protein, partial [Ignavibacteriaceae bacterium]|nr:STAS domain-containing protein [Ignavibacteriaceae bacterium]
MRGRNGIIFEMFKHKNTAVVFVNLVKATLIESNSFNDFLKKLISNGEKEIIIDLRACKTVDSTFIGAIVRNYKQVKCNGGNIILIYRKDNLSSLF